MADNDNNLVFTVSSDMTAAQRGLAKFAVDVGASADQIAKKYAAAGSKIDASVSGLQSRINGMVGIGTKTSKEWTGALADQGAELERLRARYSPLFATINNYKTAVSDIRRAHAIGAISANEMANAISKERQAALASTAAIKARNVALSSGPTERTGGVGAFQTANIAAQFQDIAVQLQGGSKPLTIALQQGTQLASVFQTLGKGQSVIGALGAAFGSLVSPVSLVTIGLIAAGGAAYQYFSSVSEGGESSDKALKNEAELIDRVAQKWGDVLPELKKYADERQKLLDTKEQKDAAAAAANQQWTDLRKTVGDTKIAFVDIRSQIEAAGADAEPINALQKSFNDLTKGIADGTASAEQAQLVQKALVDFAIQTGNPAIAEFAKTFDGWAVSINAVSAAAEKLKNGPLFNENFAKSKLPTLGTLGPIFSDNGKFLTDPNEIDRYMKQQEDNRNPTIDTGRGLPVPVPTPTPKPVQLGEEPDKQAESTASKAANAYRDLLKSADDRIGQMRQEIDLLGKFGVEADAARFALDLLQSSEDKGRSLSEAQRADLQKKVELYKQYSETLAKAKLSQDLLMDRRFNSLSKEDQQVTTTLRQYGLPEDLKGEQAGQIRQSLRTEGARDELKSFFGDFKSALLNNGGDIGKAFAESIQNALLNEASKLWDKIFDQLINGILGTTGGGKGAVASGGSGIGAVIGAVTSAGGSGGSAKGGAVDKAFSLLGSTESSNRGNINSFLKSGGVDIDAAQTAWCAAFVNSSLSQVGVKGSGSLTANSFLKWGSAVDPGQALRGDVLVQNRGLGANQSGGHVGFATGATRLSGGADQLQMLSGNLSNGVGTSWVDASSVQVRRASESLEKLAGSAGTATQGLGSLGTGLGQLGTSLGSSGGASGGGGGLLSLFSGLFSGVGKTPGSASSTFNVRGYDDGGFTGPGGKFTPAGIVHKGEYVFDAATVRRIGVPTLERLRGYADGGFVGAPSAPRLSSRRSSSNDNGSPGVLQVQIVGANGDDHVRMLVKQGVGEGLNQYNENQRRGGFGSMQARYNSQKG